MRRECRQGRVGWRRVSGVICDRRIAAREKVVYKVVVIPAAMYGLQTVIPRKGLKAELKMR